MKICLALALSLLSTVLYAECTILLHGLNRSASAMARIAWRLDTAGYDVVNHDYPTTQQPIAEIARQEIPTAIAQCPENRPIHFVTHSMGGILIRAYLAENALDRLGHVVMLAPPNQGSEVVDVFGSLALFGWINGPAGAELGTDNGSMPNLLPPVDYSVGVIAGTQSINPIFSALIPGPDDGTVALESTQLDGLTDHITVDASHSLIMFDDKAINATLDFLQNGQFTRE